MPSPISTHVVCLQIPLMRDPYLRPMLQQFLGRYRHMLEHGGKDPTTEAGRELRQLVLDRREEEVSIHR